ncbi:hypothetical protein, partial [Bacillus sp. V59.32b]|uniref:hypothetical protein n=1 Tax=Bacillus sp. V59.32b TaxID=1758642 RepID=UPI000EE29B0D
MNDNFSDLNESHVHLSESIADSLKNPVDLSETSEAQKKTSLIGWSSACLATSYSHRGRSPN